jgi:ribosomal protein L29
MTEFKGKKPEELKKLLADKRKALQNFRFSIAGSKARNVKEGRGLRKEIAQIMTELTASK